MTFVYILVAVLALCFAIICFDSIIRNENGRELAKNAEEAAAALEKEEKALMDKETEEALNLSAAAEKAATAKEEKASKETLKSKAAGKVEKRTRKKSSK